ncbi:MAG: hypothetical protein P4L87_20595 [Formivibrio sp.]|nr:hypothetical protein [Formivibrio sp.]
MGVETRDVSQLIEELYAKRQSQQQPHQSEDKRGFDARVKLAIEIGEYLKQQEPWRYRRAK